MHTGNDLNGKLSQLGGNYYGNCVEKAISLWWTTLAKARGMSLIEEKDIKYVIPEGGAHVKGPKRIFQSHFGLDVYERLTAIISGIGAGKIPGCFLITDQTRPTNLPEILKDMGFTIDVSGLCMVMDLASTDFSQDIPDCIRMVRVSDSEHLTQWSDIVNTALIGHEIMSTDQFNDIYKLDNTRLYMAYYNDIPASACMTIFENDLATLEAVSTLPEYRRRGLATSLIRKALSDLLKVGVRTVSLRAESDGISVYRKIGFTVHCKRSVACI